VTTGDAGLAAGGSTAKTAEQVNKQTIAASGWRILFMGISQRRFRRWFDLNKRNASRITAQEVACHHRVGWLPGKPTVQPAHLQFSLYIIGSRPVRRRPDCLCCEWAEQFHWALDGLQLAAPLLLGVPVTDRDEENQR
jgi:hypothetical protein